MKDKRAQYDEVLKQFAALAEGEHDATALMANAAALLHEAMGERFFWTGFYIVKNNELLLGPFQGTVACMHIARGRGVCGTAWERATTLVVPDVEQFPGHIACSALSRSEIVVPVIDDRGTVRAVLDIDSRETDAFDDIDADALQQLTDILALHIAWQ